MSSHRISAEVLRCTPGDTNFISDVLNDDMREANLQVNDIMGKASPETNPNRLRAVKEFHNNHKDVCRLNPGYVFELCQRGLENWSRCAIVRVGLCCRSQEQWR